MMKNLTQFGKAARKYRVDNGLSQADMAKTLGVSAQHLSAVERGHKPMDPEGKTAAKLPDKLRRALMMEKAERLLSEAERLMDEAGKISHDKDCHQHP